MSTGLMAGKRGLIMGLANDKSIAWGIAQAVAAQGAELAFSYQGEALKKRVEPLAASLGRPLLIGALVVGGFVVVPRLLPPRRPLPAPEGAP